MFVEIITFTPVASLFGGLLLAICVSFYRTIFGRVLGISGQFGRIIHDPKNNLAAFSFIGGLVIAGLVGSDRTAGLRSSFAELIISGTLVGLGTQLGNGCTSGHGLCGISRFSLRSLVAVAVFMFTAILTRWYYTETTFTMIKPMMDYKVPYPVDQLLTFAIGLYTFAFLTGPFTSKAHQFLTNLYSGLIGFLFGSGLIVSGMANPAKVLTFLSFPSVFMNRPSNSWPIFDPSLMLVMVAGIIPNLLAEPFIKRYLAKPRLETTFAIPTNTDLTPKLFIGSALFGIGWGITGLCPGPAAVSLSRIFYGELDILYWITGFVAGVKMSKLL